MGFMTDNHAKGSTPLGGFHLPRRLVQTEIGKTPDVTARIGYDCQTIEALSLNQS